MNWKDYPHLFANGMFRGIINWGDGSKSEAVINGYFNSYPFEHDFLDGKEYLKAFDFGSTAMPIDNCTLIARKIEDMTDEELYDCEGIWHDLVYYHDNEDCISAKDVIEISCEAGVFDTILHLLSIGVYPFDQSHFETGDVIDIRKL